MQAISQSFGLSWDVLPRTLPMAVGGFFQAFGGWISIPFLGGVISFVGVFWAWIVYVKTTEVSQESAESQAILVATLPFLVMMGVIFLITIVATIG
jgi:hypothetical protein